METLSIWLIQTQPNVGDVWEREYPILWTTSDNMGVVVAALEYRQDKWYEVTGIVLEGKLYRLRIRRLTPRECFRLQGFPDWAYERAESVSSKSQLYKQAGNSVTVTVIEAIARDFRRMEEEEKHEPTT